MAQSTEMRDTAGRCYEGTRGMICMAEDQHIEWKSSWRDEYLKWICGFANAQGGVLVIGRNDQGRPVDLKDAARLMEDLPSKIRDVLGLMVAVNLCTEEGKEYLEIRIDAYPSPISYKGEYYFRSGSTNQRLKGAALDRFLLRKHGRTWDSVPHPGVTCADLDSGALEIFRKMALRSGRLPEAVLNEAGPALLEKLRLTERHYLTRAAILLFHPHPQRYFTGASVKIGFFETNADLRYQDEIEGSLISQVNRVIEVLKAKYLKAWISYEGIQRLETWPVPLPALREAVLNAVIHKDYASGIPIQISVYADKLMIWNPGELPSDWTIEKLLGKHASIPYNPDVAGVFFRAGMIEAWGQGIERILDACREAGTPVPEVKHESTGLWVEFPYHPNERVSGVAIPETGVETPVETLARTPVKTSERILEVLAADPDLALADVAKVIGRSLSAVERASAKLVKEGRLRHVGPRKGGRWAIIEGNK